MKNLAISAFLKQFFFWVVVFFQRLILGAPIIFGYTDCAGSNALSRALARFWILFRIQPSVHAINNTHEGMQNLMDILDAFSIDFRNKFKKKVVFINCASRGLEVRKKHPNGTPFCWFTYKNVLVVSSYSDQLVDTVEKLQLSNEINVVSTAKAVDLLIKLGFIPESLSRRTTKTQFRGYEFQPWLCFLLFYFHRLLRSQIQSIVSEKVLINSGHDFSKSKGIISTVDNFENCKTNVFFKEKYFIEGENLFITVNNIRLEATFHQYLADATDGELTLIGYGSSGLDYDERGDHRCMEIIVPKGRAASLFSNCQAGDNFLLSK